MTHKPRHKAPVQAYFALAVVAGLFITVIACVVLTSVVQEKLARSTSHSQAPTARPAVFAYTHLASQSPERTSPPPEPQPPAQTGGLRPPLTKKKASGTPTALKPPA